MHDDPPIEVPIDGTLDLHAFRPSEIKTLIPDYLQECRENGILQVRIIHGKGSGTLRRTVHALLDRMEMVAGYRPRRPKNHQRRLGGYAGDSSGGGVVSIGSMSPWAEASART